MQQINAQQLDQDVVNLAKAIRQTESNGNFNARGASGEWGGYQFTKGTWDKYTKDAGISANWGEASPAQQNEVVYHKLKQWKDAGYNPGQIASMWNAGEAKPNAYRENWRGVNEYGVAYDTPAYAEKVAKYYQSLKAQPSAQLQSDVPPTLQSITENKGHLPSEIVKPPTELQEWLSALNNRSKQASTAIKRTAEGEQGLISGALQTGGAVAGGILDTAGAAIKAIPVVGEGVEVTEDLLGAGASKLAQTETGQAAVGAYNQFEQNHPTAAANIGAGINIASAIPVVRGLTMGLSSARNAAVNVIKGSPKAGVLRELEEGISRTRIGGVALKEASGRKLNPLRTLVDEDALPTIREDSRGIRRYDTRQAETKLDNVIDELDDQLDTLLTQASGQIKGYVPFTELRQQILNEVKKEMKGDPDLKSALRKVDDDLDSIIEGYGNTDLITLNDLNEIKRKVRKSVHFDSPNLDKSVRYHEGQVMMRLIEQVAESQGLGDVAKLNKAMAERIEAQKILSRYLHNKSIAPNPGLRGILGAPSEGMATVAGEAVGQSFGAPGIGGLTTRQIYRSLANPGQSSALSRYERQKTSKGLRLTPSLAASATTQGAYRGQQTQSQK